MTTFKKLPLMAFGLGLGFMSIMLLSSFKGETRLDTRYYDTGSGWKTEAQIISENPGFVPVCTGIAPTLCSGEFNETQTPGVDIPQNPRLGTFQLSPE